MADGKVTIQCLADTTKFDEQMAKLEKRINDAEKNKQLKFSASQKAVRELEDYKQKIFEVEQEFEKLSAQKEKSDAIMSKKSQGAMLTPEEFTQIQDFEKVSATYEKMGNQLDRMYTKQESLSAKVEKTAFEYERADSKVKDLKADLDKIDTKKAQTGIASFNKGLDSASKTIKNQIKNVGRWALAILGIRGAITALRQASSIIGQYDEQYAANLEYIRYALAMSIKPILEYLVGILATILQYVNQIMSAWFGITGGIFKSADAFKSAKSNLGGMAKSAKEVEKSLSSFDEVNKLQDNSTAGAGGGAGAIGPSIDLSNMQGEVPSWIKWIIDHKNEILAVLSGIGTALLLIKLGMSGIKALGFGLVVAGIVLAIQSLIEYLKDPTWENFGKIIEGIGVAVIGFGVIVSSLPAIIIGAALLIHGIIIKNWDKIKKTIKEAIQWIFDKHDEIQENLKEKLEWLPEKFGWAGRIIRALIQTAVLFVTSLVTSLMQTILDIFDRIYGGIKKILDGIIKIFKGDFWGGISQIAQGIFDIFVGVWEGIKLKFIVVWQTILNMFQHGGSIFQGLTEGISDVFKRAVNGIISGINSVMSSAFSGLNNILNRIRGIKIDFGKLGSFSPFEGMWGYNPVPVPKIPMLKTGAIINMPNKGVYVGGGMALAGEAGREGILPLTDQEAMAELGREIGKNVLINLTNIMQMNGRTISRELKKINNTQEFAYNM